MRQTTEIVTGLLTVGGALALFVHLRRLAQIRKEQRREDTFFFAPGQDWKALPLDDVGVERIPLKSVVREAESWLLTVQKRQSQ